MEILITRNLFKRFNGVVALNNVSLSIHKGKIISLIGPNGSGKTTFLNVVSGFLSPNQGEIWFKGKNITNLPPHRISRAGIGRLWQDIRIFDKLTTLENVLIAYQCQLGENPFISIFLRKKVLDAEKENFKRAREWLEFVELEGKAHKQAGDLSYGEQKLLGLARLLAANAELMLLDEPISSVDKQMVCKIRSLLFKLVEQDKTILMVEHNLGFVADISDIIILLNNGNVVTQGNVNEVINNPVLKETYLGI
jgi:ABC-type branched-subunit amino acid transport system ATPase component